MDKIPEFGEMDALDGEYRASSRSWIAVYHPEMSYQPAQLVQSLPKARVFTVITFRVRPDRGEEFGEVAKMVIAALERSKADRPAAMYEIASGAPSGTYLLFEPSVSLTTLDDGPARDRAMMEAMGESGTKKFLKSLGESVASEESVLLQINPRMSFVSKDFAAGDSGFWTPKSTKAIVVKPPAKTSAQK